MDLRKQNHKQLLSPLGQKLACKQRSTRKYKGLQPGLQNWSIRQKESHQLVFYQDTKLENPGCPHLFQTNARHRRIFCNRMDWLEIK